MIPQEREHVDENFIPKNGRGATVRRISHIQSMISVGVIDVRLLGTGCQFEDKAGGLRLADVLSAESDDGSDWAGSDVSSTDG